MLAVIVPTVDLHPQWLEAHREWGPGDHEDGFGLDPTTDVESPDGFAAWVEALRQQADPSRERRATCRWIVDGEQVLGGIALRHGMNDVIQEVGNIGYGVRPSARGRGVASWALGEMLRYAGQSGMGRLLIVCEADNIASARTIEHNGGIAEDCRETEHGPIRRFWIDLPAPEPLPPADRSRTSGWTDPQMSRRVSG